MEINVVKDFILFLVLQTLYTQAYGLWCYQCVSTQPGCGTPFDWRWYTSYTCPHEHDKCVKIIERKGADEIITRNCLSQLEYSRHDVPADKYEGCRQAAKDIQLAHYVNNSIKQLDIKRNYYDEVTWCFCEFDHFCNGVDGMFPKTERMKFMITAATLFVMLMHNFLFRVQV